MAALLSSWPLAIATFLLSALMIGTACSTPSAESKSLPLVIDFTSDESWRPLNDGVMGGRSTGTVAYGDAWGEYNLEGLKSITIRCKGEGGPFKLTMEMSQRWWMPYAYASFEPTADWQDITIKAKDLKWSQAFTGDMETLPLKQALGSVIRLGFMKYDGTAQAFDLEVASLRFE